MFGTQPTEPLPKLQLQLKPKAKTTVIKSMVAPSNQSRSSETGQATGRTDESFEGNEDELVFSLEVLRMPLYKHKKKTKQKL